MNIDKYRLAANITDYHIVSKLILQRIIISKSTMIKQLFHEENFSYKKKWYRRTYVRVQTDGLALIVDKVGFKKKESNFY